MMVKKNILLANQDYHELNKIYEYLEETNHYNIMNAANIKTAKYIIENKKIDLLLLDWETVESQDKNAISYFYQKTKQVAAKFIVLLDTHQKQTIKVPYLSLEKPTDLTITEQIQNFINKEVIIEKKIFQNEYNPDIATVAEIANQENINNGEEVKIEDTKRISQELKQTDELNEVGERFVNNTNKNTREGKEEITSKLESEFHTKKNVDNTSEEIKNHTNSSINKETKESQNKPEESYKDNEEEAKDSQSKPEESYKAMITKIAAEKIQNPTNLQTVETLKTSNPLFYDLIQKVLPSCLVQLIEKHRDSQVDYYAEITCFILKFEDLAIAEAKYGEEVYFFIEKLFERLQEMLKKHSLERILSQDNNFLATLPIHLPLINQTQKMIQFAQEVSNFIQKIYRQRMQVENFCLNYVIEIHTSSLIAGRVAQHTFAYDIWGKTTQNFINPAGFEDIAILIDEATKQKSDLDNTTYLGEFTNQYKETLKIYQV